MPNKKNKNQKNAFSFYLDEAYVKLRKDGVDVRGKQDAVNHVHHLWKAMSDEEKAPYEAMAAKFKAQKRGQPRAGRLDCTGMPIDARVDLDQLLRDQRDEQRKHLRNRWLNMDNKLVSQERFYIISFQSRFEYPNEEGYQPVEMACVEYCLRDGITREWHAMVDPGKVVTGMAAESKIFSERTHKIPFWGFESARTDYAVLWKELEDFVNPHNLKEFPPIFTKISELKKTTFCMQYVANLAGIANRLSKLFQWEILPMALYENAGVVVPSMTIIEEGADSSMYDYEADTKCEYHYEIECIYCSLLIVKKCCFFMSDAFMKIYDFTITDRHLPVRQPPQYTITYPEDIPEVTGKKKRFMGANLVQKLDPNIPLALQRDTSEYESSSSVYVSRDIRYPFRRNYKYVENNFNERGMVATIDAVSVDDARDSTIDDVDSEILSECDSETRRADDEASVASTSTSCKLPKTQSRGQQIAMSLASRQMKEQPMGDESSEAELMDKVRDIVLSDANKKRSSRQTGDAVSLQQHDFSGRSRGVGKGRSKPALDHDQRNPLAFQSDDSDIAEKMLAPRRYPASSVEAGAAENGGKISPSSLRNIQLVQDQWSSISHQTDESDTAEPRKNIGRGKTNRESLSNSLKNIQLAREQWKMLGYYQSSDSDASESAQALRRYPAATHNNALDAYAGAPKYSGVGRGRINRTSS